jgi:hypothetical protein
MSSLILSEILPQPISKIALTESPLWENLVAYQMVPQLIKELIIDTAIAEIDAPQTDYQSILEAFYIKHRLTSPEVQQHWLHYHRMNQFQLEQQAIRDWKLERYKKTTLELSSGISFSGPEETV